MKRIITIIVALVAMASGMKVMAAEKEAYAVYTPTDKTLTFYYDDQRIGRQGDKYSLNTGTNNPGWINADKQFSKVVFEPSFANYRPTSTYSWFYGQKDLTTIINFRNLKTENVTVMKYMFRDCSSLTSLGLSNFDTSNVTDMSFMFYGCSSLTSLDLSNFDTSNVTGMSYMFYGCSSLTSLNLSHFDTSKVTDMIYMFEDCSSLTSLDLSHFDTSNVTGMSYMFNGCSSLTSLDLSNFDTSKVTDMCFMFISCSSLTSLDLSHFDTSNVTAMSYMFRGCSSLTSLDLSHFDTSNVTGMRHMFRGCSSLTSLDLSHFDTSNVTGMSYMFYSCSSLTTVYVGSKWTTAKIVSSDKMFYGCPAIKGEQGTQYNENYVDVTYAHIDGGTADPGYFSVKKYDLWVSGQQVKLTNQTDVLGDGKVSYDPDTKTLTLNNATIRNTTANSTELEISEKSGLYCGSLRDLTINAVGNNTVESTNYLGLYFMNNVTITGSGSLSLKGKTGGLNGAYARTGTLTVEGGVQLTVEATGANSYGIEGAYNKSKYLKNMVVNGANTVVKAKGAYCSIGKLSALQLNDGLEIVSPADCSFSGHSVQDANGVCNDWVTIAAPAGVVTGISEASLLNEKGQMINDQAGEWYSLDGRRVLSPQKGHIYIRGGKKVVY